jgi:hypothetical protein
MQNFIFSQNSSNNNNDDNSTNHKSESTKNEEFVLEEVDNIDTLKYDDHDDFNTDYVNEMTQDELLNRLQSETNEEMKIFCNINCFNLFIII